MKFGKRFIKFSKTITNYFRKNKREVWRNLFYVAGFLFLAMAIVGFKILYPYHLLFALPFLALALYRVLILVISAVGILTQFKGFLYIKERIHKYKKTTSFILFLGVVVYVWSVVLPHDINPFEDLSDEEITLFIDDSLDISVLYMDRLEITADTLLESGLLSKDELTSDELEKLQHDWNQFLLAARDSEELTDIHKYFNQISIFSTPEEHTKSFFISYALYLKKFELFGKIIESVGSNTRVMKVLNEHSEIFGGKNSYNDIRSRHVGKETLLRRNLGRIYGAFLVQVVDTSSYGEDFNALVRAGNESHSYLVSNSLVTAGVVAYKFTNDVEGGLFKSWFPIQKNVADSMGKIHVSSRHENFITREQVQEMKSSLHPGDIFVERRNWHLSNVGIPGFWPHAALYLGELDETDIFFQEVFPYDGYSSFTDLLKERYPVFYKKYSTQDESGDSYAVIEGMAPGIILQSLEMSAMADYLGVLRPRMTKSDTLEAVLRAIGNYGKPYDYNFDFETRDEIVCSELIYDAYLPASDRKGVNFELTLTSGRKMVSPNQMVEKFYNELDTPKQELDFVYFIDGNEKLGNATIKEENSFLTSWTRSKFSSLLE